MSYSAHRNTKYARSADSQDPYALELWENAIYWGRENDYRLWSDDIDECYGSYLWGHLQSMDEYHQYRLLNFLVKLLINSAKQEISARYW
jgi:hypothetical protein